MKIYWLIYMDTPLMATRNLRKVGASSLQERKDGKDSPRYRGKNASWMSFCLIKLSHESRMNAQLENILYNS